MAFYFLEYPFSEIFMFFCIMNEESDDMLILKSFHLNSKIMNQEYL